MIHLEAIRQSGDTRELLTTVLTEPFAFAPEVLSKRGAEVSTGRRAEGLELAQLADRSEKE